ncbi:MAG TPA: tol-pal system protein YbgF [Desulfobacterales bacterium]|nr:tol-pal system protein YbgF [Desulfobacterales bacterium]
MHDSHCTSEFRLLTGLSIAMFLLVALAACAPVMRPEEDPQIAALQQEIDRIGTSNSATRKKMDEMYDRVLAIQVRVHSLEENLADIASRSQSSAPVPALKAPDPPTPKGDVETSETKVHLKRAPAFPKLSPERQYEKAYNAYAKHHFDPAMVLFKDFLQRYPKHELADNAQYWIGEIYYDMKDYPNAIIAFKDIVARYAQGSKAPDALLKIGYCYVALNDPTNARIYFRKVIKNYPFSQTEVKAQAKLKELEK